MIRTTLLNAKHFFQISAVWLIIAGITQFFVLMLTSNLIPASNS